MSKPRFVRVSFCALAFPVALGCGEVVEAEDGDAGEPADADDSTGAADAAPPEPNTAFATSETFTGDFGGLSGADATCQQIADDAELPGTYVAWLSDNTISAIARVGDARGWVRPDGKPFVDTADDLASGEIFHPLRIDESGSDLAGSEPAGVWTGTLADGTAGADRCAEWSSAEEGDDGVAGRMSAATVTWTDDEAEDCDSEHRLYCLGVDREARVEPAQASGRVAFVTEEPYTPQSGQLDAADELCDQEADAAGLGGTFKALLAVESDAMADRFDTGGDPWIRPDGVVIAETASDLFFAEYWDAALNVSADGQTYLDGEAWSGAETPAQTGSTDTCGNWGQEDSNLSAVVGRVEHTKLREPGAIEAGFESCDEAERVRCLEE